MRKSWKTIQSVRKDLNLPEVPGYEWTLYDDEPALRKDKHDVISPRYMWIGYADSRRGILETYGQTPETCGWWAAVRPGYDTSFCDAHATGPYDNPQDAINALVTRVLLGDVFRG